MIISIMNSETLFLTICALLVRVKRANMLNPGSRRKLLKLYKCYLQLKKNEKRNRRFWVRPIFTPEMRLLHGHSDNLLRELRLTDTDQYFNFLRMTPETFDELLSLVGPRIKKENLIRDTIPAKTRLELTLRYLADGSSMVTISYDFRIGKNTVSEIIAETCEEIWNSLKNRVFPNPTSQNWKQIAYNFEHKWDFKNCIGAIDGKHVVHQAPANSGSTYYNYKGNHSIHLLAVADARSCFTMVDIGSEGRLSDSGVFKNSLIGKSFEDNTLNLPPPERIPEIDFNLPYVLVGDEAFALTTYMMRPYPRAGFLNMTRKIFNYRLSRARRMVESAFGILAARWRIFRKPIIASVPTIIKAVQATVCLHNFIMQKEIFEPEEHQRYSRMKPEDMLNRSDALKDMTRTGSNAYSRNAARIRDSFATYFETIGAVNFQWEKVLRNDF